MDDLQSEPIYQFVLERAGIYIGKPPDHIEDRLIDRDLNIDGWDFIDLCEELEQKYGIDLKPLFEDQQPTKGWWIWKHKVARAVTVRELANQVITLVRSKAAPDSSPASEPEDL